MLFATITIMTTSSRMVYAFARYIAFLKVIVSVYMLTENRDGGLPASPFFSKVHTRLGLPLNALYFTCILVIIFGLIFLGSTRYFFSLL